MTVEVDGIGRLTAKLNALDAALPDAEEAKMRQALLRIERDAKQIVPVDTGNLKGSIESRVIRNSDGGEVGACGNATRCVAARVLDEARAEGRSGDKVVVETAAGLLPAWDVGTDGDGTRRIAVDMGEARTDWAEIPLSRALDTAHLPLENGPLSDPVGVSMGNPHAVFFVDDAEAIDLETHGPRLEHDPLFPERANISAAQVLDAATIRLRVWERGAGITQACGTGACATLVAAARRGLTGRRATLRLDGGDLEIHWQDDNRVLMTGPVAESFTGTLNGRMLAA
jgi:diaminopimelate epimerase